MQHELRPYRRRSIHSQYRGLQLDTRNRNQYRPTYSPNWLAIGCGLGVWFLIWQVVRVAIR